MGENIVFALLFSTLCAMPYMALSLYHRRSVDFVRFSTIILAVMAVIGALATAWKTLNFSYYDPTKLGELKDDILIIFLGCVAIAWASVASVFQSYGPILDDLLRATASRREKPFDGKISERSDGSTYIDARGGANSNVDLHDAKTDGKARRKKNSLEKR